ncbi:NUDIX hydrolase domain-like protein [Cyathus striatus]|nr:NUDIX hydrolase domain-like protein [Cyathus striatus]
MSQFNASNNIPPGITGPLEHYTSGGENASEWMQYENVKYFTNAFVFDGDKLLLGHKKRGFGIGVCSGFGGKVEPGETMMQAALRELEEESGITAPLEYAGTLFFYTKGSEFAFHIDIYRAESYTGTIIETDEMRPQWFSTTASIGTMDGDLLPIPYDVMWGSDRYWFPLVISKRIFQGRADFEKEGDIYHLRKWWFGTPPTTKQALEVQP